MKQMKQYSWNRNAAHHRIAITRFAIFSFIQSVFVMLIITLSMGIKSDGTREYIVTTAVLGLIGGMVSFAVFFVMMGVMYKWVNESDSYGLASKEQIPPTLPKPDVFYQDGDGWYKAKSDGIKQQGGGG